MSNIKAKNSSEDSVGINRVLYKSSYLYQKTAENGDAEAQFNLALLYEKGEETKKNLEKAFDWYQKAAENGYKLAQYNLALSYENGKTTEKNLEKAFYWYQKAAENDYELAQT